MYLSDRDLWFAVATRQLIVRPEPEEYGTTSIDLQLDHVDKAKFWNTDSFAARQREAGAVLPAVEVAKFDHRRFSEEFGVPLPEDDTAKVFRRGEQVILRPGGFFLWQTKEKVGTPERDPRLICFINGKSKLARLGLLVHMTAPTIHAGWWGNVTLELGNLGPFNLVLAEGDTVAQIVVAVISSPPLGKTGMTIGVGQRDVSGAPPEDKASQ